MKGNFLYNTVILTVSDLLMRCIGMAFQVWLAGRIGSAGIGLFQLILSVGSFTMTLAISGIRFGTTRLVSEELGRGSTRGAVAVISRCVVHALVFGCGAGLLLFWNAERIGFLWVGDGRTVLALRLMAPEMPFVALSTVLSGYFTACGRVTKPAVVHLLEQLLCIGLTAVFLLFSPAGDVERDCAAVTLGGTIADGVSFFLMLFVFLRDVQTHERTGEPPRRVVSRLLRISMPLAVSAYTRSGLSTLQHMLIPVQLRLSGMTVKESLSVYGAVHGMAMAAVTFPACILQVVAELLIPDLTALQVQGCRGEIQETCTRLLRKTLLYAGSAAVIVFCAAGWIGEHLYHTESVAFYIRILTPLIPVMFSDIIVDGCLKGLGEHVWCMGINIMESAVSVVLVYTLVPRYGLTAFLLTLYADELLNFWLSISRLARVTAFPSMGGCKTGSATV